MILGRTSLRYLWQHPWLLVASVLGVALGVAVVVAIDLANESARRAFTLSAESLAGRATHQIVGGPQGLEEGVYRALRVTAGVRACAPVVEGHVRTPAFPGRTFQLLGIDPLAEGPFRPYARNGAGQGAFTQLLTRPATILLAQRTARELRLANGDRLALRIGDTRHEVTVVGVLVNGDALSDEALASVLITDIASAQELLGMQGRLSRIDLIIREGDERLLSRILAMLPANAAIVQAAQRSQALEQMTRAFRLNLTALSLLALVVGMFLIYNIMTFSVVQRRSLVGTLRALGVTRWQVFTHVLAEALTIGLIGTMLGLGLGFALGSALLTHVVRTINDLYFVLSVNAITVTAFSVLKGSLLGLGASALAALAPAWEATRTPVASVLRRSAIEGAVHRGAPRAALAGALAIGVGVFALLLPSRNLMLSYAALFAVIFGFALTVPMLTRVFMRALAALPGLGVTTRLATRGVATTLSRTGVAIAALAVAISASVGVGIMIESFRHSFDRWLGGTLRADIYVSAPVVQSAPSAPTLDPELINALVTAPGVAAVRSVRRVRLEGPRGVAQLSVVQTDETLFESYQFKHGNASAAWQALQQSDAVIVSEPYAYRHDLRLGDAIRLRTDHGEHPFTVAGVYYDYGSEEGRITISRATYDRHWQDRAITAIGIYVQAGTDSEALMKELRTRVGERELFIRSNKALREASLEVFDRTFTITTVLRLLATIVAFIGVLSALTALQLERARERAILQATGLTPRQLWQLVTTETGLMGFFAGLLALPLGVGMALALVLVINRRSFGWSLQVFVDPVILIQGLVLAVIAALLAGLYPAVKMTRAPPALALREE